MGFDARAFDIKNRVAKIDPALLPQERLRMQWSKIGGGQGGGRLGIVHGGWWFGQVRVMRENGRKVWKVLLTLDDRQESRHIGTCATWGEGEKAGLQWLNDKLIDWAEVRHRVKLARDVPMPDEWPPLTLVKYEPPRPWWCHFLDFLFGRSAP